MIDWFGLLGNAVWVLGCALALAVLSYSNYEAHLRRERMRAVLGRPSYQAALNLAGALFAAGMAATSQPIWQMVAWLILAVLFAAQAARQRRASV